MGKWKDRVVGDKEMVGNAEGRGQTRGVLEVVEPREGEGDKKGDRCTREVEMDTRRESFSLSVQKFLRKKCMNVIRKTCCYG